jgi:hypothetical protein
MQEVKQPEGGKTLCQDCPHWHPEWRDRSKDALGSCRHPKSPWMTHERMGNDAEYAMVTDREDACLLPAKGEP